MHSPAFASVFRNAFLGFGRPSRRNLSSPGLAVMGALALAGISSNVNAASGTWTLNNSGTWSGTANWATGVVADGAGFTGDFSQININNNWTVTIDTTPRTLGTLTIGDSDGTHNYIIAASGGATLTFNNNGSTALLSQVAGGNTISAPIILADHLSVSNTSGGLLTLSGGFTGSKDLSLNANATGGITLSSGTVNNAGSVTNSGVGSGTTTISSVIGSNVTGVIQDSATSQLTLSGSNTFAGGVSIKKGTVLLGNSSALGSGSLLLGDSGGSSDASLFVGSQTIANAITVQGGSSGNTLKISTNGGTATRLTGNITLDNNLTLAANAPGGQNRVANTLPYMLASGTISGTGNLTLDVSGNMVTTNDSNSSLSNNLQVSGPITTSGTIFNSGAGTGWALISGNISNAAALVQDSATSMLTLSGSNSYAGPTSIRAGVLRLTGSNAIAGSSALTVDEGGSLQVNSVTIVNGPAITLSGAGTFYSSGALVATNNVTLNLPISLAADATILSSQTANTTLTLSGPITGSGMTLTAGGVNNITLNGTLATDAGGLTKIGSGNVTLSGSNSFAGTTRIQNGAVVLNNINALAGGGDVTFEGGSLRHSSSNTLNLGTRIVNSSGPISIDTNGQSVTYSGIGSSNKGGLTKLGNGVLTLSGVNSFAGPLAVNAGVLAVDNVNALPSVGDGLIFIDSNGALSSGGAYANVQGWLNSGNIAANSTGAIALTGNSSESIDFSGYSGLSLGASSSATYTGAITPAAGLYRLGGGGATLTLSANNALSGANALVVANSPVTLTGSNGMTGATAVNGSTLTLSGVAGSLANSDITVNRGATLALVAATTAPAVTRASSVTLKNATMTVTGNSSVNSTDAIASALTIGSGGNSTVTLNANSARNTLLTANSFNREAGGTALIRGTNLGNSAFGTINTANIFLNTPNLVNGILVGVVGDTSTSGTGYGTTGGLLTYDVTNGVRLLTAYSGVSSGDNNLNNVRLSSISGTATTTLNANTSINSLSLQAFGAGTAVQVGGSGTLALSSGVIHYGSNATSLTSSISNAIDFSGKEAIIMSGGSGNLDLSGALLNTGGNGVTITGNRTVTFSGGIANAYTGTTTVNGGTLNLNKTAGVNAVTGDLVINSGATVNFGSGAHNQIADSASVTVNGGNFAVATSSGSAIDEKITNLTVNGGSVTSAGSLTLDGVTNVSGGGLLATTNTGAGSRAGQFIFNGALNLSDRGALSLTRSQSVAGGGVFESMAIINGGLNITNSTSGAYTAITINHGTGIGQKGGQVVLNSDVSFTGNQTNANTVLIDSPVGSGSQGVIALTGTTSGQRVFNVGDGAANVDLRISAPLIDGSAGPSGLTKVGLGTLDLTGSNSYTGATVVNAGTLLLNGSSVSAVTVDGGALGGSGGTTGSVTVGNNGVLAPGNSPGVLSTGDLSLTGANSTIAMEIAGTGAGQYDQINVTGGVNLDGNGKIELTLLSFVPQPTDIFFLILNDGADAINGTLYGIAQGGTFDSGGYTWQVSYTGNSGSGTFTGGNDLALQVIPEPSTWLLLTGGLMAATLLRRRRQA